MKRKILKFDNGKLKEFEEEFSPRKKDNHSLKTTIALVSEISGLGFEILAPILVGIIAGLALDSFFSTTFITATLIGVGFFVSMGMLIRIVSRLTRTK